MKMRVPVKFVVGLGLVCGIAASTLAQSPLSPVVPARNPAQERPQPGAGLGSGAPASAATSELKLGSYIDIDESIRNEMYGTIDFPNAELKDIIKSISRLMNKNFILDRKIENRRITIISPVPVTKQEAYNAFLSALYINDLSLVSMGNFLKIIESKNALQSNIRVFVGDYAPPSEEVVTVLYPLKYLNAEEIQRFITDLVPRNGRINAYPNTNTLVMTDTGLNIRRIIAILKSIDIPGHEDQLESLPIRHASAKQIAALIDEILEAQSGGAGGRARSARNQPQKTRGGGIITKIVPDERTNSLVVLANGRGVEELKNLVSKLDSPNASGGGNIHIYYCKNAVAEELSTTINTLISGSQQQNRGSGFGGFGGNNNANIPPPPPRSSYTSRYRDGDGVRFEGNVKVTSDKATNSLVIIASGSDYAALRDVLKRLDVPRRQVYVEATIMEIKTNDKSQFGVGTNIAAEGLPQAAGFIPNAGISQADLANAVSTPAGITGLVAGFQAGKPVSVTINGTKRNISTVTGLIKAVVDYNQGQILHQPQILTSDNQEATINITNKVPVASGSTTAVGATTAPSITINKEDVEIELKITPQIGQDNDLIKLKVEQKVDDYSREEVQGLAQTNRTTRKANTTVVVRDSDTIVIGGLQKSTSSDSRSKFPLLGDLPVLGWLFKGSSSLIEKSNLVLFLTPRVINSYSDLLRVTSQKIESRARTGAEQYDPKDRFRSEIDDLRKTNKASFERPEPKSWGYRPTLDDDVDPQDLDPNPLPTPSPKTDSLGNPVTLETPTALRSNDTAPAINPEPTPSPSPPTAVR